MLKFVSLGRDMPGKRPPRERAGDFHEIYAGFAPDKAGAQASRCSQCGVPFCQVHCPLANNIPDWLKLTAEGRIQEAHELSQATNNFPEICGRICPQDRLCESRCVIQQSGHGTVTIGAIEKFINDTAWDNGWVKPLAPAHEKKTSVGIIGAGPAGLACAEELRKKGYTVTVYDRHDRAGGLLTYGIPGFKLDKEVVARRVQRLADGGIVFKLAFEVGRDANLDQLRRKHDAIFIATGVYRAREIDVPGSNLGGIVPALDYLIAANRAGFGDALDDKFDASGKNVVVIGGGDTAMDCLRTAIRQGAKAVSCLYRRDKDNMPGSAREVANAEEEGVKFEWLTLPKAFNGAEHVESVRVAKMRLGMADASGRKSPEEIKGSDYVMKADLVIKALGFEAEFLPMKFAASRLSVAKSGAVIVKPATQMTSIPGVFAGGDIVRGASLVVWAIKDGRDGAAAIHKYLEANIPQAAE